MNLYEISATLENGAVHKTKIYEINQERALNRASKFALQFDPTGCAKKTVQLIQKNAGVPKETERAFLNEIKEILEGLGKNSYCAMAFEGCVEDAEENIDNDFAVSMKGRWQTECKAHENIRKSLTEKVNAQGQRIAELEAELQEARRMGGTGTEGGCGGQDRPGKGEGKDPPGQRCRRTYHYAAEAGRRSRQGGALLRGPDGGEVENSVPVGASNSAKNFRKCRKAQVDALRLLGALGNIGGPEDDD